MALSNARAQGGRVIPAVMSEKLAVVNKSDVDVHVNDSQEPFSICVFKAGDIAPETWRTNCVQTYYKESALPFMAHAGDKLEIMTEQSGDLLLAKARELGSFAAAYELLRKQKLVGMSDSPNEVIAKQRVINALLRLGVREADISPTATTAELRSFYANRIANRSHLQIVNVVDLTDTGEPAPLTSGGRVQPVGTRDLRDEGDEMLLRKEITKLGGNFLPAWGISELTTALENLKSERVAKAAELAAARKVGVSPRPSVVTTQKAPKKGPGKSVTVIEDPPAPEDVPTPTFTMQSANESSTPAAR